MRILPALFGSHAILPMSLPATYETAVRFPFLSTCAGVALLLTVTTLDFTVAGNKDDVQLQPLGFEERCNDVNVVLCDPLDSSPVRGTAVRPSTRNKTLPEALLGKYRDWRWCTHNPTRLPQPPVIDSRIRTSGSGSLRFTIVGSSEADVAGYCQMNFAPDLSVQFGEGETFFVQFRVRYSCTILFTDCDPASPDYQRTRRRYLTKTSSASAVKISIINTGDHPFLEYPTNSCSDQHLVLIVDGRGVLQGYHSCAWYDHHQGSLGLDKRTGNNMWDLQPRKANTGPLAKHCHQKGSPGANRENPTENCFLMPADEWVTITQQVTIGQWVQSSTDPSRSSNIKVWMQREGQSPQLVIDYDRNLKRPEKPFMKYGKIWLVPYITDKNPKDMHPDGFVWYDELIVSRGPIAPVR